MRVELITRLSIQHQIPVDISELPSLNNLGSSLGNRTQLRPYFKLFAFYLKQLSYYPLSTSQLR
ncbi:hypothetical protein BRC2024_KCUCJSVR_CDS_0164 [Acinetobacter phage vB_AbaM_KissB]